MSLTAFYDSRVTNSKRRYKLGNALFSAKL